MRHNDVLIRRLPMGAVFVRHLRLGTYILLSLFIYPFLWPEDLAVCKTFQPGWVGMVIGRNLAMGWMLYGGWHYILYDSPLHANLEGKKFNKIDQYRPGTTNKRREMFYTTQGLLIGAIFECLMMHLWGTGRVPYVADFWASPVSSIGWVLFVGYWRDFHFFWIHRWMVRSVLLAAALPACSRFLRSLISLVCARSTSSLSTSTCTACTIRATTPARGAA